MIEIDMWKDDGYGKQIYTMEIARDAKQYAHFSN